MQEEMDPARVEVVVLGEGVLLGMVVVVWSLDDAVTCGEFLEPWEGAVRRPTPKAAPPTTRTARTKNPGTRCRPPSLTGELFKTDRPVLGLCQGIPTYRGPMMHVEGGAWSSVSWRQSCATPRSQGYPQSRLNLPGKQNRADRWCTPPSCEQSPAWASRSLHRGSQSASG